MFTSVTHIIWTILFSISVTLLLIHGGSILFHILFDTKLPEPIIFFTIIEFAVTALLLYAFFNGIIVITIT